MKMINPKAELIQRKDLVRWAWAQLVDAKNEQEEHREWSDVDYYVARGKAVAYSNLLELLGEITDEPAK